MGYKVIHYFTDLQDFNHPYKVGDIFPRKGLSVSDERIRELSSKNNRQGKILIEKLDDDFEQKMNPPIENNEPIYTKTEINRMSTADLRKLALKEQINSAKTLTGAELKKLLIEKLNL